MLELYKNIKKFRTQLGITQQELAIKAGYKDKSMIAKIEKGLIDLPQSKIITFSEIFGVEPSELMGWNDYFNGSDGIGNTELERFRNSIYYKNISKYDMLSNGLELMLKGLYDSVEEVDIDNTTYYKLTRGEITYYIEYVLLETIENRVSSNIRSLIKDFNNNSVRYTESSMPNAAHTRTDIDIPENTDISDNNVMDDENF